MSSNVGIFQCSSCGFMEDDFSFFQILSCEEDVICVGCYDSYIGECDTVKEESDGLLQD